MQERDCEWWCKRIGWVFCYGSALFMLGASIWGLVRSLEQKAGHEHDYKLLMAVSIVFVALSCVCLCALLYVQCIYLPKKYGYEAIGLEPVGTHSPAYGSAGGGEIDKRVMCRQAETATRCLDTDGNGLVSREEFVSRGRSASDFDLYDWDGNDTLDRDEMRQMAASKQRPSDDLLAAFGEMELDYS